MPSFLTRNKASLNTTNGFDICFDTLTTSGLIVSDFFLRREEWKLSRLSLADVFWVRRTTNFKVLTARSKNFSHFQIF
jgi:hypothetical protein